MRTALALVLAVITPLALQAQEPARVSGVVRDSAGTSIGDVGVLLLPGGRNARTDASGRFRFDSVAPAAYKLHFRRLGFLPAELPLTVASGLDTTLTLTLARRPRLLDTVVVASKRCSRIYFDGFLCRRRTTPGIFLTEADILAKNPRYLADIFLDMADFHVHAVPTPYGPSRVVRTTESRCLVTLFDGRRPVATGELEATMQMEGAAGRTLSESDYLGPRGLIGVEIYPAGFQTPEEYGDLAVGQVGDKRTISGSPFTSHERRTGAPQERCVLVNYWTTAALRSPEARGLFGFLRRVF